MAHPHAPELRRLLIKTYGFRERGNWLQQGKCPSCGKREMFTRSENPWLIKCGRENKCGYEDTVKTLFPEVFEDYNERYKPTDKNPNATADAYLAQHRGFPIAKIKDWYQQGKFWNQNIVGGKGTATVRFYLNEVPDVSGTTGTNNDRHSREGGNLAKGSRHFMERFVEDVTILDPKTGEKKTRNKNFQGSHGGLWWQPPGFSILGGDEIWLVEGILDAIALNLSGIKAVATLSCVNFPDKSLEPYTDKKVTWRWALDNDPAGQKYTERFIDRMRKDGLDTEAAFPPPSKKKVDWNDLYLAGAINDKTLDEYRYYGDLFTARNASAKAVLMYENERRDAFCFDYNDRLYWFKLDFDKYQKIMDELQNSEETKDLPDREKRDKALKQSNSVSEIANCNPKFLYFQANQLTDESWYYCHVKFPHGQKPVKNTFTGNHVSSAAEFKKRLISMAAGALYTGSSGQLDSLMRQQLYNIKTVETVDYIGYSKEHETYVFSDIAVKDGRTVEINEEDYFTLGKTRLKSLNKSVELAINTDSEAYSDEWVELLYQAWGAKGLVALAYWLGSLFAEQIRAKQQNFPFLEVVGEAGTGKTTLIEFLWRLFGRNYEGFDPSKATHAGRARVLSQVSGMPIVFIESDRDEMPKSRKFDWEEMKTAYNGRANAVRGMKTGGNETYEPPFRGALVISQNAPVAASDAIMSRICHLFFKREDMSPESKVAADALAVMEMEKVSGFILRAVSKEKQILEHFFQDSKVQEKMLAGTDKVKMPRIAETHGQLQALVTALKMVIPLDDERQMECEDLVYQMAQERQGEIDSDHPVVAQFWELFDYLNDSRSGSNALNHYSDQNIQDGLIAVNLNHFYGMAQERKQEVPPMIDLKTHLKTSRSRKFRETKPVSSRIWLNGDNRSKTVKCWVFENGAKA